MICYNDERFNDLSKREQNQILWAGLIHDLGKRTKPLFEGKDHVHPFRSAGMTLKIFVENDMIAKEHHEKALELAEFTMDATVENTDK